MVDWGGLENRYTRKGIGGSNPPPTAREIMKPLGHKTYFKLALVFFVLGLIFIAAGLFISAETIQFPSQVKVNFSWQKGVEDIKEKDFFLAYAAKDDGNYLLSINGRLDHGLTLEESQQSLESKLSFNLSSPKDPYAIYSQKQISPNEATILAKATDKAYVEGIYYRLLKQAEESILGCAIEVVYMVSARSDVTSASFAKLKEDMKAIVENSLIVNYKACYDSYKGFCSNDTPSESSPTKEGATIVPRLSTTVSEKAIPKSSVSTKTSTPVSQFSKISSPILAQTDSNNFLHLGNSAKILKIIGYSFLGVAAMVALASIIYRMILKKRGTEFS